VKGFNVVKKSKETAKPKHDKNNPYKEGSRKAEIYDVFLDSEDSAAGLKNAYKRAEKLGIKAGTVKSWSSMWLRGEVKPGKKEKAPGDKPDTVTLKDGAFHPMFKYTSREKADKEHEALCTRNGIRPHAFHVIEDDGRFAVVPSHYQPGGPVPTFKAGDIVYDALIANSKAKVIEPGPEQTMVRYVVDRPSRPREDCVINRFLVKLPDDLTKAEKKLLEKNAAEKPDNKKLQKAATAAGVTSFGASKPKLTKLDLLKAADKIIAKGKKREKL
jgi:hypothetical protein